MTTSTPQVRRPWSIDLNALLFGQHPERPADFGLTNEEAEGLMRAIYQRGDRLMGRFLLVHALIAAGLSTVYETWLVSAVVTLAALGLFFVNAWLRPATFATRVAAGVALQTFVALHIYQMHGLAEMHFWFFTAFTMMIVYQDWLCMWPGALLIIAQHILFALLHNSGVPLYFFEVDYITVLRLFFHFGIAVVQVGICGYWAVLKRRETFLDAGQRARLRRQSLELEEARDEALSATRTKSEFLATMSHEIRTPMNGVIGMAELLRESSLDDSQRECAEVIHQSGHALLRIINDILDLSKIEAGRVDLEVDDFDVRRVVDATIGLVADSAARKGLVVQSSIDQDVPEVLSGDAGRIRQVLLNYLGNAIKYTGSGSIFVRVSVSSGGDRSIDVRFAVEDTGIGIAPEHLESLFQEFSRVRTRMTADVGGTGLGLAICQRLAELMNGSVGVESQEGRGSSFWFQVPLQRARHRVVDIAPAPGASIPTIGRPWRVLVVDDNEVNQRVSMRLLERLGCRADIASDGKEAIDCLGRLPYDLVLMDCHMPIMDGYAATSEVRRLEQEQGGHIPIIALTAAAIGGERERCFEAGMDDYLAKPVTPHQLAAKLTRWLRSDADVLGAA